MLYIGNIFLSQKSNKEIVIKVVSFIFFQDSGIGGDVMKCSIELRAVGDQQQQQTEGRQIKDEAERSSEGVIKR